MYEEYPKWVYFHNEPREFYAAGEEPVLAENDEQEATLKARPQVTVSDEPLARRGRPPKVQ